MIDRLKSEFPQLDDTGMCETEHCCELTLAKERKRLHAVLDSIPKLFGELVEIGTDKDSGQPRIVVITNKGVLEKFQTNLLYKQVFVTVSAGAALARVQGGGK